MTGNLASLLLGTCRRDELALLLHRLLARGALVADTAGASFVLARVAPARDRHTRLR